MTDESESKRIFISYRQVEPDRTLALDVASRLGKHHQVFIDLALKIGQSWADLINSGLKDADFVIVLLSNAILEPAGDMVRGEIELAHFYERQNGHPVIVPVPLAWVGPILCPVNAYVNRFYHLLWDGPEDSPKLLSDLERVVGSDSTESPYAGQGAPIDQSESAGLHKLAKRVRYMWIDGVLKQSLLSETSVRSDMVSRPAQVRQGFDALVCRPGKTLEPLGAAGRIVDVFEQHLGQILITGLAGSGKTTLLLRLAGELLDRWDVRRAEGVPVVFKLSSWGLRRQRLEDWLAEELQIRYDVPRKIARRWILTDRIVPLLDGLDEVSPPFRDPCVAAINEFRKDHGLLPIAVSARTVEYTELSEHLRLPAAISIEPLSGERVLEALSGTERLVGLHSAIERDNGLLNFLNTPLMLNLAIRAYDRNAEATLEPRLKIDAFRFWLFTTYINAMTGWRRSKRFRKAAIIRFLAAIAVRMKVTHQSIFQIEHVGVAWLPPLYRFAATGTIACLFGLLVASPFHETNMLLLAMIDALTPRTIGNRSSHSVGTLAIISGLCYLIVPVGGLLLAGAMQRQLACRFPRLRNIASYIGLRLIGLALGALFASYLEDLIVNGSDWLFFAFGVVYALVNLRRPRPADQLSFWLAWAPFKRAIYTEILWGALAGGVVLGFLGLTMGMFFGGEYIATARAAPAIGAVCGIAFGVMRLVFKSVDTGEIPERTSPNGGTWRSLKTSLKATVLTAVTSAVSVALAIHVLIRFIAPQLPAMQLGIWLGCAVGISCGTLSFFGRGGAFWIQHWVARLVLACWGVLPFSLTSFLRLAQEQLFIYRAGGAYLFGHSLLMDHFASLAPACVVPVTTRNVLRREFWRPHVGKRLLFTAVCAILLVLSVASARAYFRAVEHGKKLIDIAREELPHDPLTSALVIAEIGIFPEPSGGLELARKVASNWLPKHGLPVQARSIAFSANGERILTTERTTAQLWDTTTGAAIRKYVTEAEIDGVAMNHKGDRAILIQPDENLLKILDLNTGSSKTISVRPSPVGASSPCKHLSDILARHIYPLAARFSVDERSFVIAYDDHSILHLGEDGTCLAAYPGGSARWRPKLSIDGSTAATLDGDFVIALDLATGLGRRLPIPRGLSLVATSKNGKLVLLSDGIGRTFLQDTSSGKRRNVPRSLAYIGPSAFSPDAQSVVSAIGAPFSLVPPPGVALKWNPSDEAVTAEIHQGGENNIYAVVYSPDGRMFATASSDGVRLWAAERSTPPGPSATWADLVRYFRSATTLRLSPSQRQDLLGEAAHDNNNGIEGRREWAQPTGLRAPEN